MRTTIIILAVVGVLLLVWSWWAARDASQSDFGYAVPGIAGIFVICCDVVLVIVYALYRLLFT